MNKHYLPTMTVDQLMQFTEEASNTTDTETKARMLDISASITNFMYDDGFEYPHALHPYKDSVLSTLIKMIKMTAPDEDPDKKVKATANDLRIMVSQTTYGVTGTWLELVHSGFSVKLKPIDATTRINFQAEVAKGMIELNRLFTGDMNTAIYFEIEERIMKLFLDMIDYTTFMAPNTKNFLKYLRVKDSKLISVVLLILMYPNGYEGFRYICGETITAKDDSNAESEPKMSICGRESESITLDLSELVYLQNDFTEEERAQLKKKQKNILTEKEVLEYQENFKYNASSTVMIDEELSLALTFNAGNIHNYLNKSRKWLEEIILKSGMNTKNDLEILSTIIANSSVGKYYYSIEKIETNVHYAEADVIDVKAILTLSSNREVADRIITAAKDNIANTAYTIAIPRYICPICEKEKLERKKTEQTDEEKNEDVNEGLITSINVLDLFIYLV